MEGLCRILMNQFDFRYSAKNKLRIFWKKYDRKIVEHHVYNNDKFLVTLLQKNAVVKMVKSLKILQNQKKIIEECWEKNYKSSCRTHNEIIGEFSSLSFV